MDQQILTSEEMQFFHHNGYLVIDNALTTMEVDNYQNAISNIVGNQNDQPYNLANILQYDTRFLDLIDISTVFPKIWGILGANIWVNHTHFNVNPPEAELEKTYYGWHRDGGTIHFDLDVQSPLMSLKTAFYLTDVSIANSGETYVIPGSHLDTSNAIKLDSFQSPPKAAIPLRIKAGTAVIYHQRLVHSLHSPNYSNKIRQVIFIQWAYRWLAAVDPMSVKHLDSQINDPIRRQLLGLTTVESYYRNNKSLPYTGQSRSGRYYPRSQEIPLRQLITEQSCEPKGRVWSL